MAIRNLVLRAIPNSIKHLITRGLDIGESVVVVPTGSIGAVLARQAIDGVSAQTSIPGVGRAPSLSSVQPISGIDD